MRRYNNGKVFSNNQCIACNKCISVCNIFGANVATIIDGRKQIYVDDKKCLQCGKCIQNCPHGAREFLDDSDDFIKALKHQEKMIIVISPLFDPFYQEEAEQFIGYLQSFDNVEKVFDASFGEEISVWAHTKYLKENQNKPKKEKAFIANSCEVVVRKIENFYPHLSKKIIPIHSSIDCAGIYIKKYMNFDGKITYLGPCVTSSYNINDNKTSQNKKNTENEKFIDYYLTFNQLFKKIKEQNIDFPSYSGKFDKPAFDYSYPLACHGNMKELVARFFPPSQNFITMDNCDDEQLNMITSMAVSENINMQPLMIELDSCKNGCIGGAGLETEKFNFEKFYSYYIQKIFSSKKQMDYEEAWKLEEENFASLDWTDFSRLFSKQYTQKFNVPDHVYENIFDLMLKDCADKRSINCGSCGYKSCKEMAKAIAYGYNFKENCIHYMNDLMQKNLVLDMDTGFPNKTYLFKYGKELIKNNVDKKYVICNGDINGMKIINDVYGFSIGDKVIMQVGKTLTELVGKEGICVRLGGGIFSLIMEYTPSNMQILHNFKSFDCRALGIQFPVTMRFGIYIPDSDEFDLPTMVNFANICMDHKISSTQNTFTVYSNEKRRNTIEELELASEFQIGLDNKQFVLWFQPQYRAQTGDLIGAEALCRWIKSDGTIVSPSKFIPIAEKNGFIRKLDVEIWRMAFEAMHRWLKMGINPVPVSVNISRVSLSDDILISTINHLADEYEVPVQYIHFEVTESAYMEDQKNLIARINKLRELGFQIAMDDFGSGYSSLNTLKDLPIDILKLDMGFLRDQTNMDKGGRIISTLVRMAQNLEYTTIAEGVENQEQADFLCTIGVDIIQGFLYSPPMPENQYISLLSSDQKIVSFNRSERTGIIQMANLYDPASSESIMFDKLSGPSAILEYTSKNQHIELLRINQKCLKIFGFEQIPFREIKKNLRSLFSKDAQEIFIDSIKKSIQTNSEVIAVTKNRGSYKQNSVWIKIHVNEISQKEDAHTIYVSIEDVTDEKNSEKTLELSNRQLTSMLSDKQTGMWLIMIKVDFMNFMNSLQLNIIKSNSGFEKLSGYSESEIMSFSEKEILSLIHPKDRPLLIMSFYKNFMKGFEKRMVCQYNLKRKDGTFIPLKFFVDAIKQDDDTYLGVINFIELEQKI